MKVLIFTGSPRKNGNSAAMADAFAEGVKSAENLVRACSHEF